MLVEEMAMLSLEHRRSDRLMLTIPLRARGVDARGESFEAPARTINLSQYGARVYIPRPLRRGQTLRLINLMAKSEADFRVIGLLSTSSEKGGNYGLECLDAQVSIWQIEFPVTSNGNGADAKALLECRMCKTVKLANLSLGELEALRTAGIVGRQCETCKKVTPSRFAEIRVANLAFEDGWMAALARLAKPRRHRRVCLQLPLGVRDSLDGVEVTRSENVSKGGFCFSSEKEYQTGQPVMVAFPGEAISRLMEVPGQIVWQRSLENTKRRVYGMHCERLTH
jgi:hypothetical protein